jgi:hypothetical protein
MGAGAKKGGFLKDDEESEENDSDHAGGRGKQDESFESKPSTNNKSLKPGGPIKKGAVSDTMSVGSSQ